MLSYETQAGQGPGVALKLIRGTKKTGEPESPPVFVHGLEQMIFLSARGRREAEALQITSPQP
jgi:hypothetical protein